MSSTVSEITRTYLFGSSGLPISRVDSDLVRDLSVTTKFEVDINGYMKNGAGRFATGQQFDFIQDFFTADIAAFAANPNFQFGVPMSKNFVAQELFGYSFFGLLIDQTNYRDDTNDYGERVYIFNSGAFKVADEASFIVESDGRRYIDNYAIVPDEINSDENFDFEGAGYIAFLANPTLEDAIDPYKIGRQVDIEFIGDVETITYDGKNFFDELIVRASWGGFSFSELNNEISGIAKALWADGTTRFLDGENRPIKYGTVGNDSIDASSVNGSLFADLFGVPTIDDSAYGDNGIAFVGGEGNDELIGGSNSDWFLGGSGNDRLFGESFLSGFFDTGIDVAEYVGSFFDYRIEFNADGSVSISDEGGNGEGMDTLIGIERAQFSDTAVSLEPGQDIAFVVDTTGSMWDDIASVKSSATGIINAIFDPERGLLDSRVAVVGFNDPTTETVLTFTDQPSPEDRKTAALNAINSLGADGGGDFPEMTFSGLLRALDGRAGEWREDAVARKIVLFGDATAKDGHLASQVYALAANLNVATPSPSLAPLSALETFSISEDISLATFSAIEKNSDTGEERIVPVQIFTVSIGSNSGTRSEFKDIADQTGGSTFDAAGASDIVDALLEVINLPIYTISAASASVTEGDNGSQDVIFTVSRDVGDTDATVVLNIGGSADGFDFTGVPEAVEFAEGETSTTFTVSIYGDVDIEADETLSVSITAVSEPATFGASAAVLTILNDDEAPSEPLRIKGSANDDTDLRGTDADEVIVGRAGNDIILALGGEDRVFGGVDNDSIDGGEGNDLLIGNEGNDTLLGGIGDDQLRGKNGVDSLDGGVGNDTLWGDLGEDVFLFGEGDDLLRGDRGKNGPQDADLFILDTLNNGTDRIIDFSSTDRIDLQGADYSFVVSSGGKSATVDIIGGGVIEIRASTGVDLNILGEGIFV